MELVKQYEALQKRQGMTTTLGEERRGRDNPNPNLNPTLGEERRGRDRFCFKSRLPRVDKNPEGCMIGTIKNKDVHRVSSRRGDGGRGKNFPQGSPSGKSGMEVYTYLSRHKPDSKLNANPTCRYSVES